MTPDSTHTEHADLEPIYQRLVQNDALKSVAELPPLDQSVPEFKSKLLDLLEELRELFSRLFGSPRKTNYEWFANNWEAVLATVFLLLILGLLIWAGIKLKNRRGKIHLASDPQPHSQAGAFVEPAEKLSRSIEDALREGRVAEAARLRWKLFLLRSGQTPTPTPQEYAALHSRLRGGPQIEWTSFLNRHYELMFQDSRARLETYRWVDERLRQLELPDAGGPT